VAVVEAEAAVVAVEGVVEAVVSEEVVAELDPAAAQQLVRLRHRAARRRCRAARVRPHVPAALSVNRGLAPHVPVVGMLDLAAETWPGAAGPRPVN
jgi:hypothetical protein